MAYKSVNVEITQEHFDRSIKGSPKEAVKELIWNACDADAKILKCPLIMMVLLVRKVYLTSM